MLLQGMRWSMLPKTHTWLQQARLDWSGKLAPPIPEDPAAAKAMKAQAEGLTKALCAQIDKLLREMPGKDTADVRAELADFAKFDVPNGV